MKKLYRKIEKHFDWGAFWITIAATFFILSTSLLFVWSAILFRHDEIVGGIVALLGAVLEIAIEFGFLMGA